MKIKFSPLPLKIAILISSAIGIISVIWYAVYMFQTGLLSQLPEIPGLKAMVVQHSIVGTLYLLMAVYLFKLVGGTSNREIISRKNLMYVRGILYILLAVMLTRIIFSSLSVFGPLGSTHSIAFRLTTLIGGCWEPLMGILAFYILSTVFKRAIIFKEEEALTI
ncbi:DUF2975 domain-containing protein [Chitinophaga sp.]|uniref:DUF2975 domain-containing protein n=1 Tax=Chitinophaga sp. TaxID=1869181 RepID=UPI002F9412FC